MQINTVISGCTIADSDGTPVAQKAGSDGNICPAVSGVEQGGANPCDGSGSVNSYPDDAAFCPSWAKHRICSHYYDQDQCAAAAGCEYDANTVTCTPVYTTSDFNFTKFQKNIGK